MERCRSGRSGRSRKPLYPYGYPGFESLSFRQQPSHLGWVVLFIAIFIVIVSNLLTSTFLRSILYAMPPTSPFTRYIDNEHHYDEVIARFATVDRSLWIGTADLKDVYVKLGANAIPLLGILDKLVKRNVEIRLLHAKEPGPAFQDDFDRYPSLIHGMERALCPRGRHRHEEQRTTQFRGRDFNDRPGFGITSH